MPKKPNVAYADWYGAAVASAPTVAELGSLYSTVCDRGWRPRHAGVQGFEGCYFIWFQAPRSDVGRFYV